MKLHLSDLDELVQKVRNVHPKNYLIEAIISYRAGAYRAALITTWIAVCVDIIEKIRELSNSGDAAAKVIEERLNKIKPNDPPSMLAFEKDLLDIASNQLEFLSVIEKAHLERLKEDRNICAHPTFSADGSQFSPLPETALSYIVQAANYLLIHQPVKGRVVVERLYELINEPSFPNDDEKAFIVLSSDNNLGRTRPASIRNLAIVLLKRLFRDENGISLNLFGRIMAALGAISRLNPDVYQEVIKSKLGQMLSEATEKQLKRAFPFLVGRIEEWNKITEDTRVRIEGLISTIPVDELISFRVISLTEKVHQLTKPLLERVGKLKDTEKEKLLMAVASPILKNHAIDLFINSRNFDSAEQRGEKIILPLSKHFDNEEVNEILVGACENTGGYGYNQILHAGSIEFFFSEFYKATREREPRNTSAWITFHAYILSKNLSFERLNTDMIADGLVVETPKEVEDEEPDWPFDIPF